MKKWIAIIAIVSATASCKPTHQEKLLGKWQAVSIESPQLAQQIKDTKIFIDTVGSSTSPEENMELYGIKNMDSLRRIMNAQLDTTLMEQERAVRETWFHFLDKKNAVVNFGNPDIDSLTWFLEEDTVLVLEDKKIKIGNTRVKMNIHSITEDSLCLIFNENGFSSTVIFTKE